MSRPQHSSGPAVGRQPQASDAAEQHPAACRESSAGGASHDLPERAGARPLAQEEERPSHGAATAQPAAQRPARRAWRGVSWVLAAALVICALLLQQQLRRAEVLAGQVASMRSELEGARSRLALYEGRMSEVRLSVSELLGQVAGLRDLVNQSLPGEAREDAAPPSQPAQAELPAAKPSERRGATPLPGAEGRPATRL